MTPAVDVIDQRGHGGIESHCDRGADLLWIEYRHRSRRACIDRSGSSLRRGFLCGSGHEPANRFEQKGRFKRLLEDPIRAYPLDLFFIYRLDRARRQEYRKTSVSFDVFTQFVTRDFGHRDVGDDQIGLGILETQHRDTAVADGNNFVSFVPQNPLTHPLRMRAVVGEQYATHGFGGVV